jgi:hypothetical protein
MKLIGFLLAQFHWWRVELSIMSDDVLFAHLSHVCYSVLSPYSFSPLFYHCITSRLLAAAIAR